LVLVLVVVVDPLEELVVVGVVVVVEFEVAPPLLVGTAVETVEVMVELLLLPQAPRPTPAPSPIVAAARTETARFTGLPFARWRSARLAHHPPDADQP